MAGALALASAVDVSVAGLASATPASNVQPSVADLMAAPIVRLGAAAVAPGGDKRLGALSASQRLTLGIAFAPRDPNALAAFATAVSTPGSAAFGHFITPSEFRAEYGPTPTAVAEVQAVLRAEGLTVSQPSRNGLIMHVSAPVATIERAFHVAMSSYRLSGRSTGWAATAAPALPSSIASDVTAVLGLDNLVPPHDFIERSRHGHSVAAGPAPSRSSATLTGPRACQDASAGAHVFGGYTFDQLASSYGITGLYGAGDFGQNETVDVFELEPFSMADVSTFDTCYFGAAQASQMAARVHVVPVDGGLPPGSGTEAILDVEDIQALAPGATVNVYEAPSSFIGSQFATNDIYDSMVSADNANVISTSWGLCEPAYEVASPGAQEVENSIFEEAAAQGQTTFAAAGDSGSNDCTIGSAPTKPDVAVDDPASQPFVVGVGGTTLFKPTAPPSQTVWNDGPFGGGGGGGISTTWASPGWQSHSGVTGVSNFYSKSTTYALCVPIAKRTVSSLPPCREVPDVAIDADENTGTSFYQAKGGGWGSIGGTSTAAPMWAAIATDVTASAPCDRAPSNPDNHQRDLGFIAPALYEAAGRTPAAYDDITTRNNDIFHLGKGYPATVGYDMASGLGTPVVTQAGKGADSGLTAALCQLLASAPLATVTGLSPSAGPADGGTVVVVSGHGFGGSGTKVLAVSFGSRTARSFYVSEGTIRVVAPPDLPVPGTAGEKVETPGPVDVTVTLSTSHGIVTTEPSPITDRYIYIATNGSSPLPSVSGVGPSGGSTRGGNVVDIFGSGFGAERPIRSVTFGGIPATDIKNLKNYELQVTVPAVSAATRCSRGKGFDPNAVCQVQVVVTGAHGSSPTSPILPAMTGNMFVNDEGIVVPPKGTEIDPAPSEYDYSVAPVVTSVSPQPFSESKGNILTIKGSGFSLLTIDWVNVGMPTEFANTDTSFTFISATELRIQIGLPPASKVTRLPGGISVFSLAGLSNTVAFRYGP
jgi:subtilase family serine protease